jgi:hypothetical protein
MYCGENSSAVSIKRDVASHLTSCLAAHSGLGRDYSCPIAYHHADRYGMEDYHLHQFAIGRRLYSVPDPDDDLYQRKVIDEHHVSLGKVVPRVGTQFSYLYDFGDSWEHDLLLEAILLPEADTKYPKCVAGEHRTPPEDVGGVHGYAEYLEAMADPEHQEHENMLLWRGPFDPELFSPAQVNRELQKQFRARKPSKAGGTS